MSIIQAEQIYGPMTRPFQHNITPTTDRMSVSALVARENFCTTPNMVATMWMNGSGN